MVSLVPHILSVSCKNKATTGPIKIAKIIVPNPNTPPSFQPISNAIISIVVLTLPIGMLVILWRPVIHPSRGPGPRFAVK